MASDMEKIVILGYGGHAKSVIDSIIAGHTYDVAGYTDLENKRSDIVPYLGTDSCLKQIFLEGVHNAAFGMGFMGKPFTRKKLYEWVKEIGFNLPVILDPSAIVSVDTQIGEGTFVGKRAVVNAGTRIGKMCIINTGAVVEHENTIGDNTHIAVGAVLCGNVRVGENCLIGANSTILQELTIGSNSIIGGGSIVLGNVENNVTRYGKIGGGGIDGIAF